MGKLGEIEKAELSVVLHRWGGRRGLLPCGRRRDQASLPDYEAQTKRGRVGAHDAGSGARGQGAADGVVHGVRTPGRARHRRTGR